MPQVSDIRLMVRAEQPVLSTRTKVSYKDLEWTLARKRQMHWPFSGKQGNI